MYIPMLWHIYSPKRQNMNKFRWESASIDVHDNWFDSALEHNSHNLHTRTNIATHKGQTYCTPWSNCATHHGEKCRASGPKSVAYTRVKEATVQGQRSDWVIDATDQGQRSDTPGSKMRHNRSKGTAHERQKWGTTGTQVGHSRSKCTAYQGKRWVTTGPKGMAYHTGRMVRHTTAKCATQKDYTRTKVAHVMLCDTVGTLPPRRQVVGGVSKDTELY